MPSTPSSSPLHAPHSARRATRRWGILALSLLSLLAAAMATATILGATGGQGAADRMVYDTAWFSLLWAGAAVSAAVYLLRRHVRRAPALLLHGALLVILAGAAVTHLTAHRGRLHLRLHDTATAYTTADGTARELPFSVRLEGFEARYHGGGEAASDYLSTISVSHGGGEERATVAMNRIYHAHGVRLYQSGYDDDGRGTTLSVSEDDWGTGVSYTGYALLLAALLWLLAAPGGRFRTLLRRASAPGAWRRAGMAAALALMAGGAHAQRTLPREAAEEVGRTLIVYNGRVCPLETFAADFTLKLHGSRSYRGLTPCQVLTGVVLFPEDWLREPFLRVRGRQLRERLGLDGPMVAPQELLSGGYRLGPMLQEARRGSDKLSEQVVDMDDRLMLLVQTMRLESLRMFPYPAPQGGEGRWYAPTERQPESMPEEQRQYVRTILPMASALAQRGRYGLVVDAFARLAGYQRRYGGASVPSRARLAAEHAYNSVPLPTLLFMANLALGLLSAAFITRGRRAYGAFTVAMGLSWAALTAWMALRWAASGNIPMGNGYETMLLMAWMVMAAALCAARRARVLTTFGLTVSGLLLLVSHLSQMDPAISQRMPVLNSPLLTLHVSVVMVSYALLALTFAASVAFFALRAAGRRRGNSALMEQLKPLSELFLYPAVAALAIGIFLGAVWANVSWGAYWSWDPKETWALITLLAYSVPLHQDSIPALRRPAAYHLYLMLAFACLAVTYFGVNYLMQGMHSYA